MSDEGEVLQKRDDTLSYKTQIINGMNKETLVRPYMLFNEQLFRFELYRTCDGNYLFLDIHHIIADGTSLGIIINDINRAYSGEKLETEKYTSYDLALDNKDALAGDAYKNAENYYKSCFEKLVEVLISIRIKAEPFQQQSFIIGKPVNFLYRM